MPLYTFRCRGCGRTQTIQSSIANYPDTPSAYCTVCHSAMARDYKADKPRPAAMWPEHYNPSTGTVVRSRQQLQDDLNRGADDQFNRTGIPSSPVVVERGDMEAFRAEE